MQPQFTIIVPCFNVEDYLACCLDSIIFQTIDFKSQVQVIIVDDGSHDSTLACALKYAQIHSNIQVITQSNQGVSQSRNNALKLVSSEYVMFVDGDDYLSYNALETILNTFNTKEVGCVVLRDHDFEQRYGFGILDYKFTNQLVDIKEEYRNVQIRCNQVCFKTILAKQLSFDHLLKYNEDTKFVCEYLLLNPYIYFLKDAYYYYRRRIGSNLSVMQDKESYINELNQVINHFYQPFLLIDNDYQNYFQYLIMHSLQFKIKNLEQYYHHDYDHVLAIIKQIKPTIITKQKNIPWIAKLKLLDLINIPYELIENKYYSNNQSLFNLSKIPITITRVNIIKDDLYLFIQYFSQGNDQVLIKHGDNLIEANHTIKEEDYYIFDQVCGHKQTLKFKLSLNKTNSLKFILKTPSTNLTLINLQLGDNCFIKEPNITYLSKNYNLSLINKKSLSIKYKTNEYYDSTIKFYKKSLFNRFNIILIQQGQLFDLNLEQLYQKIKGKHVYYIDRLIPSGINDAIKYGSRQHLELLLNCDYLIVNEPFNNPFIDELGNYRAFFKYQVIYLGNQNYPECDYHIETNPCFIENSPILPSEFKFEDNLLNQVNRKSFLDSEFFKQLITKDFMMNDTLWLYHQEITNFKTQNYQNYLQFIQKNVTIMPRISVDEISKIIKK